jgi:hypothetical protein
MIEETIKEEMGTTGSNIPNQSTADYEAEYVPLPSQGIYYKGKYKGLDKLKVRKLNWTDEDILTTKSYYDNGILFEEILKNTIIDENGFQAEDLVPIDRDTIIWWLRIGAFGTEYSIPYTCTNDKCKNKSKAIWNLADFETPDINTEYESEILETGGILLTLPISLLKCKITVPSIGKETKIQKFLAKRKENISKKSNKVITKDFAITGRLLASVEEVYDLDGTKHTGSDDILTWLNQGFSGKPLPIVDSRYIIKKLKEISLKVDTSKDIDCEKCDHVEEGVEMPMSIYFFWPEFEELSRVSNKIN